MCVGTGWTHIWKEDDDGFKVSQKRVGRSLKRVDPLHHVWRKNTTRRLLNPVNSVTYDKLYRYVHCMEALFFFFWYAGRL